MASFIRIQRLSVKNSYTIEVSFTTSLDSDIGIENVTVESAQGGGSGLTVTSVSVSQNILTIAVRPMVDGNYYKLILESTTNYTIKGIHGERFLEDGKSNIVFFVGSIEDNEIRDTILSNISDIYNKNSGSLIFDSIANIAKSIEKVSHSTGEVSSANYISIDITDEAITRGSGPFDRFEHEGVFELLRVGSTITGSETESSINFDEFPTAPVSLQQIYVSEELVSNSVSGNNSFSGLTITLSKGPIIKITSITLTRDAVIYIYDIEQYRYGLKESKYDPDNSYQYLTLIDNQLKLNESAIGASFPFPQGSDTFTISYYYKKTGRVIGSDSISITSDLNIYRESSPAVSTSFFLNHAPIVNNMGEIPTRNGITWLDPAQNYDENENHPAFITEIQYNQLNLPSLPGQYSVNYSTGQVFVFGVDGTGTDGTTTVPPVATYIYQQTYQEGLDYRFYSDINEVVSLPNRDLRDELATIWFSYEDTFADGTDFNFASHIEILNERVNNNLIDTIGIKTTNYPINEVFRIYNETTGEIYIPTRVNGNEVYFNATVPPNVVNKERERVKFLLVIQSQLVITDRINIAAKSFIAFKIELEDSEIGSSTENYIGVSFNSSLIFSDTNIFIYEYFFDPDDSVDENLVRLTTVGDYMTDYENGIVYLAALSAASTDIGDATYKVSKIETRYNHIIRANDVYRSPKVGQISKTYAVNQVADTTIDLSDLEQAGERTVRDNNGDYVPIVVDGGEVAVRNDVYSINHIYQVTDLQITHSPIDFSDGAEISSSSGDTIILSDSGALIIDDGDGSGLLVSVAGTRCYVDAERLYELYSGSLAQLISAINAVDINTGVNYYTYGSDGYVDATTNRIYFPTSATSYASGKMVVAQYRAALRDGAAVLVDYVSGDMFVDYSYTTDEILINYEYGDNVLDWSISDTLNKDDIYYVTYRYGALRTALRDNFGILSGLEELSTIPDNLSRETYRDAVSGALQTFPKGPVIPAIKQLVKSFTQVDPNITESVFLEWILGRDSFNLEEMKLSAINDGYLPTFAPGKFGDGLLLNIESQTATIPAVSNLRFEEGTWESFVVPNWAGIDNDASITFDIEFDGQADVDKVFIGSNNEHPTEIPFTLNRESVSVLGRPSYLHSHTGYFIWFDTTLNSWALRVRAPAVIEERSFEGTITTTGEFYNVAKGVTADAYEGIDGYSINEITDTITSTDERIKFSFIVDAYDVLNDSYDSYDSYSVGVIGGFDGIDFTSDHIHYFFDTGYDKNNCRMSLYKDGKGFIRFRIYDSNKRVKMLSANIHTWERYKVHHLACSWKMNTIEGRDELHLFIDGAEVPNTYRYRGYFTPPSGTIFMDEVTETLLSDAASATVGATDLVTIASSAEVNSASSTFVSDGITVGSIFQILDDTIDGIYTQTNIVTVLSVSETSLILDYTLQLSLHNVKFTINSLQLLTTSDNDVETVRVFVISDDVETELYAPGTTYEQYNFSADGYLEYVNIYDGVGIGDTVVLRSYGLMQSRYRQYVYIWPDKQTNLLKTVMPQPISVSKINITNIIVKRLNIEPGVFALIATSFGGHVIPIFATNLSDFCQPSNDVTGRLLSVTVSGDNIDWDGVNQLIITGTTTDGYDFENFIFTEAGTQISTRYFTSITEISTAFTPIDSTKKAGTLEIRETHPITWQENDGDYAEVHLSIQQQAGVSGVATISTGIFSDAYSRFDADDIGKLIVISSPSSIASSYIITDVNFDPSGAVKDSDTITLNTTWSDGYTDIVWKMLSISYGDSGFANGLITLEIFGSGGLPFLLRSCWYEIDFPTYLTIPWTNVPEKLYIGSNMYAEHQANATIDEMRILDEISLDTGMGSPAPSSGRSITTDALVVKEFTTTTQTLALFHFNSDVINNANFYSSFSPSYHQSENSVNSLFKQSAIFNKKEPLQVENKAIFGNDSGTIEFWISPILDTYNDPTDRYYIDLSTELQAEVEALSALTIVLTNRARSIDSVMISGSNNNYFIGGTLANDGLTITLTQPLPTNVRNVVVTYIPITSQGDRFSVYKNEDGFLVLFVMASDIEYQIRAPIYWKKNSWHRVFVGWDLNNTDNQDRLILMADGTETGIIRYGTGLKYGEGHVYGSPTIWGSATVGTTSARNILADINLLDLFNIINIGADFTGQYPAMARLDNLRISDSLRTISYLGGSGPGKLIGKDTLYTSNLTTAQPVISDALTRLLLDFDTDQSEVEYLTVIRNMSSGIFDFFVEVIDSFSLIDSELEHQLVTDLINSLKPAHTRAFVSFTK